VEFFFQNGETFFGEEEAKNRVFFLKEESMSGRKKKTENIKKSGQVMILSRVVDRGS